MKYFQRKYPFIKHKINTIISISLIVFLILYIFQPFGFGLYKGNKFTASLGFGLVTFVCFGIFNYTIKNRVFLRFKKWTILAETIYVIALMLCITVFNYLYFSAVLLNFSFNITLLLYFVLFTFLIGLIPATFQILLGYNRYLKTQLYLLIGTKDENENIELIISNQLAREKDLVILLNDFLFAEAKQNNVEVYFLHENENKSEIIRTTMTSILNELDYPNIFRCHRSFIVNLNYIESAKGNSNGYQINLKHYKLEIPVSRKYANDFKKLFY